MLRYPYPGNVRELMNICERLVVMTDTELIDIEDLPSDVGGTPQVNEIRGHGGMEDCSLQKALDAVEKTFLSKAIAKHGNQSKAASALGVNQSTIARKMKKHGLS